MISSLYPDTASKVRSNELRSPAGQRDTCRKSRRGLAEPAPCPKGAARGRLEGTSEEQLKDKDHRNIAQSSGLTNTKARSTARSGTLCTREVDSVGRKWTHYFQCLQDEARRLHARRAPTSSQARAGGVDSSRAERTYARRPACGCSLTRAIMWYAMWD